MDVEACLGGQVLEGNAVPTTVIKTEAIPVEAAGRIFWVSLQMRRISRGGGQGPPSIQYWAFLPPGMHPTTLRGKDRDEVLRQAQEVVQREAERFSRQMG